MLDRFLIVMFNHATEKTCLLYGTKCPKNGASKLQSVHSE